MADKVSDKTFIEQIFTKLFDLLDQLRTSINSLSELLKARPCFISQIEEEKEKCESCALTRLEQANKRLIYVVGFLILLDFLVITGLLGGLGFFADQYGNQLLQIIENIYTK
jgi:hypothetical protein